MILKIETCECCGNVVKTYGRKIPAAELPALIRLKALNDRGETWVHYKRLRTGAGNNFQLLRHFGLIYAPHRIAGQNSSGLWATTELGRQFVDLEAAVPLRWIDRKGVCLGHLGPFVGIIEAAGEGRFSYVELMERASIPWELESAELERV